MTDGTLRLLIGVISAGVLLLLLACGILPSLKIGDANFSGGSLTWQMVLMIGFVFWSGSSLISWRNEIRRLAATAAMGLVRRSDETAESGE